MSAREILTRFLKSDNPRAMALHGMWGRGKTNLWRNLILATPDIPWPRYSYVSLFGVNSLDELKVALFEKSAETSVAHRPDQGVSFDSSLKELGSAARRSGWRSWIGIGARADTAWIGSVGAIYQAFVFSRIRRHLVCIDDIERRGSGLRLLDVLGLVTFLCEERQCSVLVILNDSTLEDADKLIWRDHREKVFDGEVAFRPSTEDCINLVFEPSGANRWQDAARPVILAAGLSNVRIISRLRAMLESLSGLHADVSDPVARTLSRSMTVIAYCYNAVGEGAPPLSYALTHGRFRSVLPEMNGEQVSEREQGWNNFLDEVEFYPGELEKILSDFVQQGYVDEEMLSKVVEEMSSRAEVNAAENPFQAAWRMYHDSFSPSDTEEVLEKFEFAFPLVAPTVSAGNADSTIGLMRRLGRDDLADRFLSLWIDSRVHEPNELQAEVVEMFGPIRDPQFREAIVEARARAKVLPDLSTSVRILATREGNSDLAMEVVASSSAEELVAIIGAKDAKLCKSAVRYVLGSDDNRDFVVDAKRNVRDAISKLAEMSPLNRVRAIGILGEG